MIALAYSVNRDWIVGGPKYIDAEEFDLVAKADPAVPHGQVRRMLQRFLSERFELALHFERRPMPVYAIIAGKSAPKMATAPASSDGDCDGKRQGTTRILTCHHVTMNQFAETIRNYARQELNRPVLNLTGLTVAYNFTLAWTPQDVLDLDSANRHGNAEPGDGESIFDAMRSQLGLDVKLTNHEAQVIVIDHVRRFPLEN